MAVFLFYFNNNCCVVLISTARVQSITFMKITTLLEFNSNYWIFGISKLYLTGQITRNEDMYMVSNNKDNFFFCNNFEKQNFLYFFCDNQLIHKGSQYHSKILHYVKNTDEVKPKIKFMPEYWTTQHTDIVTRLRTYQCSHCRWQF